MLSSDKHFETHQTPKAKECETLRQWDGRHQSVQSESESSLSRDVHSDFWLAVT